MGGCCSPNGYAKVWDAKQARKFARQYLRKGLDPTAKHLVNFLKECGIEGQTILEVGGGVGAIQVDLLRAGAARAVSVELSPAYEEVARELLTAAGLMDRDERLIMDFAREAGKVGSADVVIMHRVVCCYPDMEPLVEAAANRARRHLAISFPRASWWVRLGFLAGNLWFWLRRVDFRTYVHSPRAILATAQVLGFRPVLEHRGWLWQLAVLERPG